MRRESTIFFVANQNGLSPSIFPRLAKMTSKGGISVEVVGSVCWLLSFWAKEILIVSLLSLIHYDASLFVIGQVDLSASSLDGVVIRLVADHF